MMDFKRARQQALTQLQLTNCCRVLSSGEVAARKLKEFVEVWLLDAEVFGPDDQVRPLQLLVGLPADFPLVLPTIYLERADYQQLRYLPHVDTSGLVCTFDPETVRVNPEDPGGIVRDCVAQARRLIEQGLAGTNTSEFQQEFIAYWENEYGKNDEVAGGISLTATPLPAGPCSLLHLARKFGGYRLILPGADADTTQFKEVVQRQGIAIEPCPAFHLGELGEVQPPFALSNGTALSLVQQHFPGQLAALQQYLNGATTPPLVLFHKLLAGQVRYFGWWHALPGLNRKGFRPGKLSAVEILTKFERPRPVQRLSFDTLTAQRLTQRTAGEIPARKYTLLLAGLGSIGSNLLHYLASFPLQEMRLVDPEKLGLENVPRHLLGMEYVNFGKAEGLQRYLEQQQPLRRVTIRKDSIAQVALQEPAYLNECDAILLAVGRSAVEQYLIELQRQGVLTRPLFILWVEPYLAGGHLLYFPPRSEVNYTSLFDDGYYIYNVVATDEYRKPQHRMLLKEAGCQTSYVPYSQEYVTLFLSRVLPELRGLLRAPSADAWAYTWLGNEEALQQQGLAKSAFASDMAEGELIKTKL
ncbi:E2/UBC family protein [Hymenobacter mucosus]|uniref:ThiF family protein n=1 Tax=Hymenobacter mucosus TaxID=1411120 RepID=A0A238ZZF9_9BACT|nr:E2/UBC family protein [Hymenobacter mucosus]SNR88033.1 ThiF family protein [Hymenobacter mucosus]